MELFNKPERGLCEAMERDRWPGALLSIKLKVLGVNEATAKPWIVVLCDKVLSKGIRKFFKQAWVRKECQPLEHDSSRPPLEAVVYEQPPRPLARAHRARLLGNSVDSSSHAAFIEVYSGTNSKIATLGGLIKVTRSDGTFYIYSMTAGHVMCDEDKDSNHSVDVQDPKGYAVVLEPEHHDDQRPSLAVSRTDDWIELDVGSFNFSVPSASRTFAKKSSSPSSKIYTTDLGAVSEFSFEMDWALIQVEPPFSVIQPLLDWKSPLGRSCRLPLSVSIHDKNKKGCFIDGTITTQSYCMLPFSNKLIAVYDLVVTSKSEFCLSEQ
jgi:hypothetical protein